MILDYSQYVEVIGRESDAGASLYYPSEHDIQRVAPRLLNQLASATSEQFFVFKGSGLRALEAFLTSRVELFNAIETISGEPSHSSLNRTIVEWLDSICYICNKPTQIVKDESTNNGIPHIKVRACQNCGWWESENHASLEIYSGGSYESFSLLRRACLREFAIIDETAPLEALRAHLARHPQDLNRISPHKLEHLVGSIFSDLFSCEAIHVGGPGDGGYDLILLMSDTPALVQVKQRFDPKKTEPVSSIREFIGAMLLADHRIGFFVSTASHFSRQAESAAGKARSSIVERLDLVDASKLVDILKLVSDKTEPWLLYAHKLTDEVQNFKMT